MNDQLHPLFQQILKDSLVPRLLEPGVRLYSATPTAEPEMPTKVYDPEGQARRWHSSEQALRDAGGLRVSVRIQPAAAKALAKRMKKDKIDRTTAINDAIITYG